MVKQLSDEIRENGQVEQSNFWPGTMEFRQRASSIYRRIQASEARLHRGFLLKRVVEQTTSDSSER